MGAHNQVTQAARKTGKPRELEEDVNNLAPDEQETLTPQEFAQEFFGEADIPQVEGQLPSLSWIKDNFKTKSAAIRYCVSLGADVNTIAKHLGIKYQHVRNVATSPLKRGPNESWQPKSERTLQPLLPTIKPKPEGT